jgi:hypothetical protein
MLLLSEAFYRHLLQEYVSLFPLFYLYKVIEFLP